MNLTMLGKNARILIGMPVYNGDKHIGETIESILGQTFGDFRLLISDNASTDNTEEICRSYAQQDSRVNYYRQPQNLGMAPNFNYVFSPGETPYFKWAAHDDIIKPNYLRRCIDWLDNDSSLAMAHCPTLCIDDQSNEVGTYQDIGLASEHINERFWRVLWTVNIYEIYGVMRSQCVAKTKLAGSYFGSERNILAEVLLQGNIGYLDQALFARRDHAGSLTAMHLESKVEHNFSQRQEAHASGVNMSGVQTSAIRFREYFSSLLKYSMPGGERAQCFAHLMDWGFKRTLEGLTGSGEAHRQKIYAQLNQEV